MPPSTRTRPASSDLARDDFEIREDGKAGPLTLFAGENQPITIVVMLDKSGSMRTAYGLVRAGTEAFVRRLTAGDKARSAPSPTRSSWSRGFSNNQDALIQILRAGERPEGPTPLWNATNEAMARWRRSRGGEWCCSLPMAPTIPANFKTNNLTQVDAMERAQREDVMVYAIGSRAARPRWAAAAARPAAGCRAGSAAEIPWAFSARILACRRSPVRPAAATSSSRSADDLSGTFARVAEELHRQYALGFEPEKLDGKTHKLEVKVKKPGLKVRARKHYVASK